MRLYLKEIKMYYLKTINRSTGRFEVDRNTFGLTPEDVLQQVGQGYIADSTREAADIYADAPFLLYTDGYTTVGVIASSAC
jgi:hypothetical protein